MRNAANFVAFQLCWLACVAGAGAGLPALGPAVVVAWVAVHLTRMSREPRAEGRLLLAALAVGIVADSMLVLGGWLEFTPHAALGAPTTLWMAMLWVAFAATLNHSLAWLRHRYVAAAAGAVLGPLAYWAGARLDAVHLPGGASSLAAVAVEWALCMPVLLACRDRLSPRATGAAA